MRVTVVHITTVHPPKDGRIFYKEARSLARAGYEVTLVAPGASEGTQEGVRMVELPQHEGRPTRILCGSWEAWRALHREPADVIHFHDPELLPLAALWRLQGRTVVYDAHESLAKDVSSKSYLNRKVAKAIAPVLGLVERLIAQRLAHVVCATPAIAAQFSFPHKTVVGNYPIIEEWDLPPGDIATYGERPVTGCYIGVINEERCVTELVAAASEMATRVPGSAIEFAGPVGAGLAAPAGSGVTYLGVLPRPELPTLLSHCRFGAVVFKPLPNCIEALPTKFFEYLACGLPVIVSRSLAVISAIVDEERCGIVVDETDPSAIAGAAVALFNDPSAAFEMGQRGRDAVTARYSWSSEADKLVQLYDQLTARSTCPGTAVQAAAHRLPSLQQIRGSDHTGLNPPAEATSRLTHLNERRQLLTDSVERPNQVRRAGRADADAIADIHLEAFPEYFLTRLGRTFLKRYYRSFLSEPHSAVIGFVDGRPCAFAVGTTNLRRFYRDLYLPNLLVFGALVARASIADWRILRLVAERARIVKLVLRVLVRRPVHDRELDGRSSVLFSIAVRPTAQGSGLAGEALEQFVRLERTKGARRMELTVFDHNDRAIGFYEKHGWLRRGGNGKSLLYELDIPPKVDVSTSPPIPFI